MYDFEGVVPELNCMRKILINDSDVSENLSFEQIRSMHIKVAEQVAETSVCLFEDQSELACREPVHEEDIFKETVNKVEQSSLKFRLQRILTAIMIVGSIAGVTYIAAETISVVTAILDGSFYDDGSLDVNSDAKCADGIGGFRGF